MVFSRQKLTENIAALMQQKKLKIGEVEQAVGISTGYLTKMLKKETDAAPSADIIWKLAKVLGVSTDMLIEGDFSKATDNIQYMGNFFTRLKTLTDANEIEWARISITDINDELRSVTPRLPIIRMVDTADLVTPTLPVYIQGREVSASAYGKNRIHSIGVDADPTWVTNTAFHANITSGTQLYIFPMCCELQVDAEGNTEEMDYFDFYFEKWQAPANYDGGYELPDEAYERVFEPVCNTFNVAQSLSDVASLLYQSISRHEYDLKISSSVRSTIDFFLNPPDPNDPPF